jgi:integron integrase
MKNTSLSDFQNFLRSKSLIQEKYIPFYAHWARKFLLFLKSSDQLHQDLCIENYINYLKTQPSITNWQIRQADEAVRLYVYHYCGGELSDHHPNVTQAIEGETDISDIIEKTRKVMRIRHYSYRTEKTYIDWIRKFSKYIERTMHNTDLCRNYESNDISNYLSYLALNKRVSASTQNQAFNALLFLFRNILHQEVGDLSKTVRAKRGQRLPVVLSVKEVTEILKNVKGKALLVIQLLYGSGFRLMEAARLRVKDIDFESDLIFVRDSKGDNDRTTVLPGAIKQQLRRHLDRVKAIHEKDLKLGYGEVYLPNALERKYPGAIKEWKWQFVFPSSQVSADPLSGKIRRHHIHEKTVQSSLKAAVKLSGIPKHVSVHTLRHSFATHLLMSGVNIREIQQLLGHKNVETTMIYTHVLRDTSKVPESPLDNLKRMDSDKDDES